MRCSFWHFYLQDRSWSDWKCFNPLKQNVTDFMCAEYESKLILATTPTLCILIIYIIEALNITLKWDGLSHIRDARYPQYKSSKAKRFQIFSRKLVFLQSLGWINPNIKSWENFYFFSKFIRLNLEWFLKTYIFFNWT